MLEAYWDKIVNHVTKIAMKRKDSYLVKRILQKLEKVPERVRYEMLKRYVTDDPK